MKIELSKRLQDLLERGGSPPSILTCPSTYVFTILDTNVNIVVSWMPVGPPIERCDYRELRCIHVADKHYIDMVGTIRKVYDITAGNVILQNVQDIETGVVLYNVRNKVMTLEQFANIPGVVKFADVPSFSVFVAPSFYPDKVIYSVYIKRDAEAGVCLNDNPKCDRFSTKTLCLPANKMIID